MTESSHTSPCACDKAGKRGRRPDPRKRQAIIDAAGALFLSHGYGITMDAIAAEAGVSKQTIYNQFSTKEDLFEAVIADRGDRIFGALTRPPGEREPGEVLRHVARQFLEHIAGGPAACVQRMIITGSGADDLARRFYDQGPRRSQQRMADFLRQETACGRLSVDQPEAAAEAFFGMLNGHILMLTLLRLQTEWSPEALDARVDYVVTQFLRMHAPTRNNGGA